MRRSRATLCRSHPAISGRRGECEGCGPCRSSRHRRWRARDNELTRSGDPARPPALGKLEETSGSKNDLLVDMGGCRRAVGFDTAEDTAAVGKRKLRPDQLHRRSAALWRAAARRWVKCASASPSSTPTAYCPLPVMRQSRPSCAGAWRVVVMDADAGPIQQRSIGVGHRLSARRVYVEDDLALRLFRGHVRERDGSRRRVGIEQNGVLGSVIPHHHP